MFKYMYMNIRTIYIHSIHVIMLYIANVTREPDTVMLKSTRGRVGSKEESLLGP